MARSSSGPHSIHPKHWRQQQPVTRSKKRFTRQTRIKTHKLPIPVATDGRVMEINPPAAVIHTWAPTVDFNAATTPRVELSEPPPAPSLSDQNTDYFSYSALQGNEIRLLDIGHTHQQPFTIQARLDHWPLPSAQSKGFVALSYTWGEHREQASILVDGKPMKIRPNVLAILHKLQSLQFRYVWASSPS